MERLNDIINRTAQRRQQSGDQQEPRVQRGQQGQLGQQGQRTNQVQRPAPPLARRPLPEQTARLGQQGPPTRQLPSQPQTAQPMQPAQSAPPTRKYYQHTPRNRALSEPDYAQQPRNAQHEIREPHAQYAPYAPSEANVTRQLYGYEQTARRDESAADNTGSTGYYRTPRRIVQATPPVDDYYDTYPATTPPADVQEEWEDDAAVMRFGDWEDDNSSAPREMPPTLRRDREIREIELHPRGVPYSPITRNLQAMQTQVPSSRLPAPPASPITPLPATPPPALLSPQTVRPHRHTQPLDPQSVVNMTRELPQERAERVRQSQPARLSHGQAQTNTVASTVNTATSSRAVCPVCKGAGFLRANVPVGEPNFGKPVACACKEAERREKRRQELLELSDLSAFQNSSFSNFNVRSPGIHISVKEAYKYAGQFAQDPHGWLVLIGPNGCGKTHLAAAIANQNLREGAVVLFTVVPDLLAHLRSTFGHNATEAYDQRFAKMREAELLVLDDLGAHQSSPWASEKLFQLLNYRYNSSFPTVITANPHGLMGLDERILSRMSDMALVTRVTMTGAIDYRPHNPRR